ncbi:MAG TPA: hypothetical protein VM389_10580 [Phycisphaerae bacterium]|nr:hypothetical protein [Phycisphaerae bacterium]
MSQNDVTVLRDLASRVAEIAARDVQDRRRDLWRRHNSFQPTPPPILVLGMPYWGEVFDEATLRCEDPLLRRYERAFWQTLHQDRLQDDSIVEPWFTVGATFTFPTDSRRWGPEIRTVPSPERRGSWMFDPPLREESDLDKLVAPHHAIDEEATARDFEKISEALGDILPVVVDRGPFWRGWWADLSTDIARLRGLEQFMLDMIDRPRWLHRLLAFMRDGVLAAQEQAEAAGHWRRIHHENQAMPYARELSDPAADDGPVSRRDLWAFFASQETTLVSPAMFEEFMLQYQRPIIEKFGLSAYGCCEDLTHKIDCLRTIPNLRRISVTAWADVARCAEQIGTDYIFSWRPSPADMICTGFKPDKVRRLLRAGLDACRGCHVDITLKDVETIGGNFDDLIAWVRLAREVAGEYA